RIEAMEKWLEDPQLLQPDEDAEYAAVIEIDLNELHAPLVACPNDPDDIKSLSDVAGTPTDEAFIGGGMTNLGQLPAPSRLVATTSRRPAALAPTPRMTSRVCLMSQARPSTRYSLVAA